MADSDKELGALRALRKIECKHSACASSRAGVVNSVMKNLDADFCLGGVET